MTSRLIHADLMKWLRDHQWLVQHGYMPKAHAVMGDPPYFLGSIVKRFGGKNAAPAQYGSDGAFRRQSRGFMGKTWDGFDDVWQYQAWVTEWSSILLDFVYPGAILALFGGTRTYHRLAAGLEDAGWEVFDCMMYVYGSGFPKAADIGKLIDKSEGAEREIVGEWIAPGRGARAASQKYGLTNDRGDITAANHPDAQRFDGYKTALKPAYEPIILARAPRGAATYADLAQMWGTGAINVDAARILAGEDYKDFGVRFGASSMQQMGGHQTRPYVQERIANGEPINTSQANSLGRYPANLILDDTAADLLDQQSGDRKAGGDKPEHGNVDHAASIFSLGIERQFSSSYNDSGGASRFFYTAKASSWEREAGLAEFLETTINDGRATPIDNPYQRGETARLNPHPTVKPIQLTEYLARLFLPPVLSEPRRILVPFAGVGSEMIGAQLAGWDEIVGIERESEYVPVNEARRRWWGQFKTYAQAETAYRPSVEIVNDFTGLPLFDRP